MQVQVDSNHIEGSAELQEWVGSTVVDELERYADLLTRIEIHVGDVNAQKAGPQDKRCQIEARPKGHTPLSVTHKADSLDLAVAGAARKMSHALEHLMGKLSSKVESTGHLTAPVVHEDSAAEVDAMLEDEFLEKQARLAKD
ncbi:HPF/RaiA family ribosome-associated protein [Pseudomonas viridiflava]|uniref:Ribosomal subunit interface protein n=1 Tax=Pseudomonas viridiflava TaxID=33069 RepID=A0A3M5P4H0_PSEVI|nr:MULTISPECIES: HPF/RaiA family ribosome-associated protein [Pseudomonas syringae group]MBA1228892.1 HPF/RaiA family ribosome-associated protein [Pseudomonas viridiflava]MCF5709962.1 ribosomal subunit interface protein [Pseudomonas syringae]RMT79047.1 Ribosomal subunit interface protein [Pseudomonas viridiflava]